MKTEESKRQNFINEWQPLDMGDKEQERFEQELDEVSRDVAKKQRSACVRHYYNSDNKGGTLATITETPLVI